ncbi:MAG: quinone oxidoreductase, family protein [Hyphomicrobiales bacterium]|nr:quinone oxidoreductase, family protein [Hyphomicrobiales bacterium]
MEKRHAHGLNGRSFPAKRATTRVVVPSGPGGPEVLKLEERPLPIPGAGQVLIRTAFAGVNRHDCNQRQRGTPPPGATDVLGLEVSGEIVDVGPDVMEHRIGTRVCALVNGGGYADYAIAEDSLTLSVPDALSPEAAAALPEALFTAWLNLFELCELKPGETVLIHGGASGVGVLATQLANAFGATVFATAGSDDKCSFCTTNGAVKCFNYRNEDFVAGILQETNGRGADVILDMAGGLYAEKNLRALAMGGRVSHLTSGKPPTYTVPLSLIMQKQARITGALLRPLAFADKQRIAKRLKSDVWPLLGTAIVPVIDSIVPLEEVLAAHHRMEAGLNKGKILLSLSQT